MKVVFRFYSYVVEFGKDCRAFILDEAKAMDAATKLHGTVEPVYRRIEIPDDKEIPCESPLL